MLPTFGYLDLNTYGSYFYFHKFLVHLKKIILLEPSHSGRRIFTQWPVLVAMLGLVYVLHQLNETKKQVFKYKSLRNTVYIN